MSSKTKSYSFIRWQNHSQSLECTAEDGARMPFIAVPEISMTLWDAYSKDIDCCNKGRCIDGNDVWIKLVLWSVFLQIWHWKSFFLSCTSRICIFKVPAPWNCLPQVPLLLLQNRPSSQWSFVTHSEGEYNSSFIKHDKFFFKTFLVIG